MSLPTEGVAVVTGAGSGIGRAIALALAKPGWRVALVGRDTSRLETIASAVRRKGAEPVTALADLAIVAEVEHLSHSLSEALESVDVLVHAAGRYHRGTLEELAVEELDALYATNLRGPWLLTRGLLPLLRATRGHVVVVNSSAVFTQPVLCGGYAATKAALRTLADALRAEVNGEGIRVLSVFPGRTASAMQNDIHRAEEKPYRPERLLQPEDVAAVIVEALGLPRTAEVTDLNIRPAMKETI